MPPKHPNYVPYNHCYHSNAQLLVVLFTSLRHIVYSLRLFLVYTRVCVCMCVLTGGFFARKHIITVIIAILQLLCCFGRTIDVSHFHSWFYTIPECPCCSLWRMPNNNNNNNSTTTTTITTATAIWTTENSIPF